LAGTDFEIIFTFVKTPQMKSLLFSFLFFYCFIVPSLAQQKGDNVAADDENESTFNLGLGLGLDYGGIGLKLAVSPEKHIGIFGGLGYNIHKAGYNFGAIIRLAPDKHVVPILTAMYGYNAVIVVKGAEQLNKTYYGPSFGGGVEINSYSGKSFWNIELLVPVRSQEFKDDFDAIDSNPSITIKAPLPITFSVGYHFRL
jgi:hypothetical protein